jgi:hypothetical protein
MKDMKCPICGTSLVNELECLGLEEMEFIPKKEGASFNLHIEIGSFSIGKDNVINGNLEEAFLCENCNKVISIFSLNN